MPYTATSPNLPAHVQKMPDKQKAQWISIWNGTYDTCIEHGESADTCESKAFKYANGVVKKRATLGAFRETLASALQNLADWFVIGSEETHTEAVSLGDAFDQLMTQINAVHPDVWTQIVDVYFEDGGNFAVIAQEGKLYKVGFDIQNSTVVMKEWVEVVYDFKPVSQSLQIRRMKDGQYRFFLIAGSTVLNRNAQIDSSALFDCLIQQAEENRYYPYLTFFHLGPELRMGQVDWLARSGCLLLASGTFDDTRLANAMIRAYASEPDYWGNSISFQPLERPEMVEITEGVEIPVYNRGRLVEISILPEKHACGLFTAVRAKPEENLMEPRVEEALRKLAGEDAEFVEELIKKVDGVNRSIEDENLIHRDAQEEGDPASTQEAEAPAEAVTEPETSCAECTVEVPTEPGVEDRQVTVDDALVEVIAQQVSTAPQLQSVLRDLQEQYAQAEHTLTELRSGINEIHGALAALQKQLEARLVALEKDEDEKQQEWLEDLPRRTKGTVHVTYRPREKASDEPTSFAERANATLANLK